MDEQTPASPQPTQAHQTEDESTPQPVGDYLKTVEPRLGLRKTAMPSGSPQLAKNYFSSVDVSMDTSPSEKEVFTSPETDPDRQAISPKTSQQKHKKKGLIKFVIIIVVLLLAGGGGAYAYLNNKNTKEAQKNEPVAEVAKQPKATINTETKRYSSTQFSLDFDQPIDWDIKEDTETGLLTATSPNVSIPAPGGGATTGRVALTIKGKDQKLPELDKGNALAILDSEKVAYTKPSSAQRGQTYISFLGYPGSESNELIDGVYITGDFGYQKEQAIPKLDIQKVDPIISLSFTACDGTCTKAIGITPEAWAAAEFGGVLKKILQSFTIN